MIVYVCGGCECCGDFLLILLGCINYLMSSLLKLKNKYKNIQRNEENIQESLTSLSSSSSSSNNLQFNSSYYYLQDKSNEIKQQQQQQISDNNQTNTQLIKEIEEEKEEKKEFTMLGLLFIIIDDLPHELLWRVWFNLLENEQRVKIFIHAKYPEKVLSPWVRSHLVDFHFIPSWGSIEITKVMISLLRKVKANKILLYLITYSLFYSLFLL